MMPDYYNLNPEDLTIESWPPEPRSGMHVGTVKGVKINHVPMGISVICDSERSQHKNRAIALKALDAAVTALLDGEWSEPM